MVWPTDDLNKDQLDDTGDDPSQARPQLLALLNKVQAMLAEIPAGDGVQKTSEKGSANGYCQLDSGVLVPVALIPNLAASKITSGVLALARIPTTLTGKDADTVDGNHASAFAAAATGVTNGNSHNHIDGDGAAIAEGALAASAVSQGKLKTAIGEVSNATLSRKSLTLPGGQYGFYPQTKMSITSTKGWSAGIILPDIADMNGTTTSQSGWTTHATIIQLGTSGGADTIYAQQRYIQASPPYKIGSTNWGHFLFLLRNISTGEVVSAYEAEDPPWAYNGPPGNPKNSIERIQAIPHPFADYWDKDPVGDGLEIVLIDLSGYDTKKWISDNAKVGKGLLEDLQGNINPGSIILPGDVELPDIPGFTDKVKIRSRI